jgi:4-alpha-glucanotransferase
VTALEHGVRRSPIRTLASSVGIIDTYVDQTGRERRETSDETRRALLAAMGIDASSDAAARATLAEFRANRALIPPVHVLEVGKAARHRLEVRAPSARTQTGPWRLEVEREDGERRVTEGPWRGAGTLELELPELPLGYHRITLTLSSGAREWTSSQTLIVVPSRCTVPSDVLGEDKAFGLVANLYTVRSATNWGVGDFTDLAWLARSAAPQGADFVGVNPLHALLNRGADVSPYSPVSRLFRNPIYVDVARVPEVMETPALRDRIASPELSAEIEALRESSAVRYEQVMAVKGLVLDAAYRVFVERERGSGSARERAYESYVAAHEPALTRFATWMAIAEDPERGSDWRTWPSELRDASSSAVAELARTRASRVDFHRWVQFEADRQLAEASHGAREAGMRIGLYQDLAIGTSPAGADAWAFQDLFIRDVNIGAPPDPYSASGQNWGLPPIDPRALRRTGYRYFIDLVRGAFRHAGALRIDHVMGLFRLFWIPNGKSGQDGAYVRYPANDLLGIIALESARHRALVVGEDLGTVPRDVPPALEKWGILSSKVFLFERDKRGGFKAGSRYPELALATANTHDLPSIAGFWSGRDIEVRRSVDLIPNDEEADRARSERDGERGAVLDRLARDHILPKPVAPHSGPDLRAAVHAFLCRTPSALVGLSLDDLAGETEPVNVPGVGPEKYPSWTRKMRLPVETIMASTDALAAMRCDGRVRSTIRAADAE